MIPDQKTAQIITLARGIRFGFDPEGGVMSGLSVTDEGQVIAPLHTAPWAPDEVPDGSPRHQRRLRGDFLAAPFGAGPAGLHGPGANGDWQVLPAPEGRLRAVLPVPVMGATVFKDLSVTDDHPFLYQRHVFLGGQGRVPVANHAMIAVPDGAKLSFSRKRWWETLAEPVETDPARGRSALAYPRRAEDAAEFPGADGGTVNLHRFPFAEGVEDFVAGIEDPGSTLGWTAVVRPLRRDLVLSLRNPKALPMTMLWHSHGGRDYAPWNGRHLGCLGVEEGAVLPVLGLSGQEDPDPLTAAGQPGGLDLVPEGQAETRHVLGAIHWPSGQAVAGVQIDGGVLTVTGDWGAERKLPIREGWLVPTPPVVAAKARGDWDL